MPLVLDPGLTEDDRQAVALIRAFEATRPVTIASIIGALPMFLVRRKGDTSTSCSYAVRAQALALQALPLTDIGYQWATMTLVLCTPSDAPNVTMDNQAPSLATGLSNMRTVALRDPPPTLPDLAEAARSADPTRYLNDTDPAKLTLRQLTAIRAAYVQLRKIVFRV